MGKQITAITAKCSCCGYEETYSLDKEERRALAEYRIAGRAMGMIQNVFPKIPAWIRSGAIEPYANGFCICPKCCDQQD